jgi:hypothetical protein
MTLRVGDLAQQHADEGLGVQGKHVEKVLQSRRAARKRSDRHDLLLHASAMQSAAADVPAGSQRESGDGVGNLEYTYLRNQ